MTADPLLVAADRLDEVASAGPSTDDLIRQHQSGRTSDSEHEFYATMNTSVARAVAALLRQTAERHTFIIVREDHKPTFARASGLNGWCVKCGISEDWPCADIRAALAVAESLGAHE